MRSYHFNQILYVVVDSVVASPGLQMKIYVGALVVSIVVVLLALVMLELVWFLVEISRIGRIGLGFGGEVERFCGFFDQNQNC